MGYIRDLIEVVSNQRAMLLLTIKENPPESTKRWETVLAISPRYQEYPNMWGFALGEAAGMGLLSELDPIIMRLQDTHQALINSAVEVVYNSDDFVWVQRKQNDQLQSLIKMIDFLGERKCLKEQ